MQETFRALIAEMCGEVWSPMPTKEQGYGIANGGAIIHELGGIRMGASERDSALNANCQAWDCDNLFVADGGPFVSQADKNPTWTILALSMRTSAYVDPAAQGGGPLMNEMNRREAMHAPARDPRRHAHRARPPRPGRRARRRGVEQHAHEPQEAQGAAAQPAPQPRPAYRPKQFTTDEWRIWKEAKVKKIY